ncbi:hypothetical protein U27_06384 [Candidatus Vecturithrix granuli]|uniref:Uncharacterized protein n=1 Tax=Vecturithrix granuli TaxID=1499967 RepID=A0A081C495_VECG1|nr:hypothetical protein U27_06384 [Candidatus Vecturithrix granuli]
MIRFKKLQSHGISGSRCTKFFIRVACIFGIVVSFFMGNTITLSEVTSSPSQETASSQAYVDPALIQAAQEQAKDSMREAWRQGAENKVQPVNTLVGPDGTVVMTQNAPKQIVTYPDGSLGLSRSQTMITVIQQPTPLPITTIVPQDSRIQTIVNGIDHIETKAILPEHLVVDQLDAIKEIADNGTLIAQQRFVVEQYKINSDAQLEWLRITKSFVLWGFLFSIPFILTFYWITRNIAVGWRNWQKEVLEFKQRELESAERITMGDQHHVSSKEK